MAWLRLVFVLLPLVGLCLAAALLLVGAQRLGREIGRPRLWLALVGAGLLLVPLALGPVGAVQQRTATLTQAERPGRVARPAPRRCVNPRVPTQHGPPRGRRPAVYGGRRSHPLWLPVLPIGGHGLFEVVGVVRLSLQFQIPVEEALELEIERADHRLFG